ncbi:hypothetical protein UO65_4520 [Actinokineospora spheciospongiae]|uniref:Uncharacterized protein n=1 Tax=Actinokineospora spheciospongiae TaxID=909613 RepID=W7IIY3_9PSEU|nr:hypothetical protein UO65_4520 [Actinokineospora spheciospongiae]
MHKCPWIADPTTHGRECLARQSPPMSITPGGRHPNGERPGVRTIFPDIVTSGQPSLSATALRILHKPRGGPAPRVPAPVARLPGVPGVGRVGR